LLTALQNFLKGAAMGAADVVPGVSGGTVALLVGIYQRLIRVITRIDRHLLSLVRQRKFSAALEYIDWKFVVSLGAGLATGFVVTIKLLARYLEEESTRSLILAAFFGMVIAAIVVVAQMIRHTGRRQGILLPVMAVLGLAVSLGIFFLQLGREHAAADPSLPWLFLCGSIAICAMILPGISGALMLILLGVYESLVGKIKALLQFEDVTANLVVCVSFGLGAACGLMLFSRLLRRLLDHHPGPTLTFLCGLMAGSLPLLWPFQVNTTPQIEDIKERIYQPVWPETLDARFFQHVAVAVTALLAVLLVDWLGRRLAAGRPS
jgi:putative membrane protein